MPRHDVRRRLLDAAARVFAERGYRAATLAQIAREAGFTKGAVYSNFDSKHALLADLVREHDSARLALVSAEFAERGAGRPATADGFAQVLARRIVERLPWSRLMIELALHAADDADVRAAYAGVRRPIRDQVARLLDDTAREFGVEFTIPVPQAALTVQALRYGLTLEHGADPGEVGDEAMTACLASVLHGLVRPRDPEPSRSAT
ncbi:TetR family transcriptional regulator [Nonomuraea antimicrobica]|uniref:helix-turn-helix domain-containing protein n=1 Tax=Nonomuraea antimicrobica TaxID=561173 RepID=UPI0031EE5BE2